MIFANGLLSQHHAELRQRSGMTGTPILDPVLFLVFCKRCSVERELSLEAQNEGQSAETRWKYHCVSNAIKPEQGSG
jgi:hypothetical protein